MKSVFIILYQPSFTPINRTISSDYLTFTLDQLSEIEGVKPKRKFGGVDILKDSLMFGVVGRRTFRLKVDDIE